MRARPKATRSTRKKRLAKIAKRAAVVQLADAHLDASDRVLLLESLAKSEGDSDLFYVAHALADARVRRELGAAARKLLGVRKVQLDGVRDLLQIAESYELVGREPRLRESAMKATGMPIAATFANNATLALIDGIAFKLGKRITLTPAGLVALERRIVMALPRRARDRDEPIPRTQLVTAVLRALGFSRDKADDLVVSANRKTP